MKEKIKELIRESFSEDDYELVLSELESVNLSHVMANSESQLDSVLKYILILSEGDLNRVERYVARAKIDCRDILSGLVSRI